MSTVEVDKRLKRLELQVAFMSQKLKDTLMTGLLMYSKDCVDIRKKLYFLVT